MSDAPLARIIDRHTVEYVRTYPHPTERVWRAVSDENEIGVWFWRAKIDLRIGGAYSFGPEETTDFRGVMQAIEPPRLIRYGGPHPGDESYWQFELETVAEGTRMVFVQRITPGYPAPHGWPLDPPESPPDTPWRAGTLSGWHLAFDHMADLMDGVDHGSRLPPTAFGDLAASWAAAMERNGVFTAKQAARTALSMRRHEEDAAMAERYRDHMRATMR